MSPKTAYLITNSGGQGSDRKLHSDEGCPHLDKANDYRPVDPGQFPDLEDCAACVSGGVGAESQSQDWGPLRSLKAAAEGGEGSDA